MTLTPKQMPQAPTAMPSSVPMTETTLAPEPETNAPESAKPARDATAAALLLAWTTVGETTDAERIARAAVERRLSACVQIDGPTRSVYRWRSKIETAQEYRLSFKLLPENAAALETLVHHLHPYDTPEWICVAATHVSEKYLSWAQHPC